MTANLDSTRWLRSWLRPPRLTLLVLFVGIAFGYGLYLYRDYQIIQADLLRDENLRSVPFQDDQTIVNVGRVVEMKREMRLRERKLFLIWWVKTDAGKTWSCTYQGGFSQFRVGDTVQVIRHANADETTDYTAYLVGYQGGNRGAVSEVWALDNDEL